MKENYYDYLINLALDTKDYKWVEELQNAKQTKSNNENEICFDLTDVALENINMNYGIKEDCGIRNINRNSEYDIYDGNIVYLEKNSYTKGSIIRYKELEIHEEYFIRGWFVGNSNSTKLYQEGFGTGYTKGYNKGVDYMTQVNGINKTLNDNKSKKKWWQFWIKGE